MRRGETVRTERGHTLNGVAGRMMNAIAAGPPGLFASQEFITNREGKNERGETELVTIRIRWDDQCGNGHNTLSVCGEVAQRNWRGRWELVSAGQCTDKLRSTFPELAYLLPWHLCSSDGPLHYETNAVYLAGDRDHHGLRKGEKRQIRDGKTGALAWVLEDSGAPKYVDGPECPPAPAPLRYVPWCRVGEGKARELDAARSAAIWPDATDAQLMAEPEELRAMLRARLPRLLSELRRTVETIGFLWEC